MRIRIFPSRSTEDDSGQSDEAASSGQLNCLASALQTLESKPTQELWRQQRSGITQSLGSKIQLRPSNGAFAEAAAIGETNWGSGFLGITVY
jgi:hypothetical protein